ncbi:MAG: TonB-dependent receptor, partial [Caulobacteraceae bacterium]
MTSEDELRDLVKRDVATALLTKTVFLKLLLASTALAALAAPLNMACAQTAPDTTSAPQVPDVAVAASHATVGEVVVHSARNAAGSGLIKAQTAAKSVSTVSSAFIQTQAAVQNAFQYVALTPGALVSTADPYGLSTQGSINIHGLGQDEIGYVLEGMPLNDIGYYTAYPSQFLDSENIDEISLAQGSADLDSPAISAAGGLMTITMVDPSLKPGGLLDLSYGSYDANREFLRLDSGLIGDTGLRGFISYSHTAADNWHGPGRTTREHVDYKLVKEWGDGNRVALSGTYHSGVTPLYIEPTLDQFHQNGTNNNYDAAFTPGDSNYYKLYTGTFRLLYMSAPSQFKLSDSLKLNITPYWQYGYGNSPYGTDLTEDGNYQGTSGPYTVSIPNYAQTGGTVMANFQDLQFRSGMVGKLTYTRGPNSVIVGGWYDYSDETDTQSFSALNADGNPSDLWADSDKGLLRLPNGDLLLAGKDHVVTRVYEPFVADVLHLLGDKLTIELGFKQAWVSRDGDNLVPGPQFKARIDNSEPLPRGAIRYQINPQNQVFFSVSTNFRTPSEQTLFNSYYAGAIYAAANTNLKPEYSTSEDLGYRFTGSLFTGSATLFNYNFRNRQIATQVGGSLINESINAGDQWTYGLDLEAGTRRWHGFSPYISAEYLHAIDQNDLEVGDTYLPTAGKTAVQSPHVQTALGLSYDDGTFFANFHVKYVGSQYSTFMDDEKIPSYATADLGVGARLPPDGLKARPELKLNLINLTGANYLSSVANPTANAND